jgi:hypothetical protein
MRTSRLYNISNSKEIPEELITDLQEFSKREWPGEDYNTNFSDFDELMEFIQEGDSEEEVDRNYITRTYKIDTGVHSLEVYYSQYRKDGGLCEGEWSDFISVVRFETEEEKKIEIDKEYKVNLERWRKLFEGKSLDELFDILKLTDFPNIQA